MKCCWRSIAIRNQSTESGNYKEETPKTEIKYLEFNIENYEHTILGEGHYGSCYKLIMNNKEYTCKRIKFSKIIKFNQEVDILKNLKSSYNLPEYFNSFTTPKHHFILYNFIKGDDLFQVLESGFLQKNNKKQAFTIIKQVTNALFELFNNNLVHLDIKLENILLTNKNPINIKLIDLETCKQINKKKKKSISCGTTGYVSPEILIQNTYYYNTDIWSLGVVLYMLYTHDNFMKKVSFKNKELCINFFEHYDEKYIKNRLILNDSYDDEIYELLKLMLHKLHIYRISIHGLKKNKLLNQFQED